MAGQLKLDKTTIMVVYKDSCHGYDEYGQLHEWIGGVLAGDFGPKKSKWKVHEKSSLTKINVGLDKVSSLTVTYGLSAKKQRIWLQFNPSKLSDDGVAILNAHINVLFYYGMSTLWDIGTVTRSEFAYDVMHANFADYLYIDGRLREGDESLRPYGTSYVGSRTSPRHLIAYDKSIEQAKKKIFLPTTLRLEARLQGSYGYPLREIDTLKSPFDSLLVVPLNALELSTHQQLKSFHLKLQASTASPTTILNTYPIEQRKALMSRLKAIQAPWWSPEEAWAQLPAAVDWFKLLH